MNAGCTVDQAKTSCASDYNGLTTDFNDQIVAILDAEATKIRNQPGFKKKTNLSDTIQRTKRFYRNLLKTYFVK